MNLKEKPTGTAVALYPSDMPGLVELLVGHVRPLEYQKVPLTSWPCRLMAAIVEAAGQTDELLTCSWGDNTAVTDNDLTVETVYGYRLPDAFDGSVFAILVAKAIDAEHTNPGNYASVRLNLRDVVKDLRLNPEEPEDYRRVSAAIERIRAISIVAHGHFDPFGSSNHTRGENGDKLLPLRMIGSRFIDSYDTPGDEDLQGDYVQVRWSDDVYAAITAITTAPASTGASVSQVIQ